MSETGTPNLAIPAYDVAMYDFMSLVMDGLLAAEPMLGQIHVRESGHAGPTRNVPGPEPVDHPLTTFREAIVIHADVIRGTDVEPFVDALVDLAGKYQEALGRTFTRTLTDVTEATGNVIDARSQPVSWDHLLDAIEKIDLSFDENGNPETQIIMHPNMGMRLRGVEMTPDQQQRGNEIIRHKKETWDAQKRARRLPRRDQGTGV